MDAGELVKWEDEYPEIKGPGAKLAGLRYREGLTQKQLSEMTGISQHHISEMENNKRPIGKKNAAKLARALNTKYQGLL